MKIKTVYRGRRTIYQLRDSNTREIVTAASAEYLDFVNGIIHETNQHVDHRLRMLCNYRESKLGNTP